MKKQKFQSYNHKKLNSDQIPNDVEAESSPEPVALNSAHLGIADKPVKQACTLAPEKCDIVNVILSC
jgi:hypothetical protein